MHPDNNDASTVDREPSSLTGDQEKSRELYEARLRVQEITPRQWLRENSHIEPTTEFRKMLWVHYTMEYRPPIVPGFTIEDVLGEGGMGRVYLAYEESLKRHVAIKELTADLRTGGVYAERFRLEAEILAKLNHPNIVKVHQFIKHDGREFIAMEYCVNGSLADRLGGTVPDAFTAIPRMIAKLARAADHAHCEKIIHRDLKPGNILLDKNDEPRLSDFGLAKDLGNAVGLSRGVIGTPEYRAPEQTEGKPPVPGTDIWAFGVILYRIFTGRYPFNGHTINELHTAIRTARPDDMPGEVPAALRAICMKCLEKDPKNRYQRGDELAGDLERFLYDQAQTKGGGVISDPVSEETRKRQRRRLAAAVSGLALLVTAVAVPAVIRQFEAKPGKSVNMREPLPGPTKSIAFSADGNFAYSEVHGAKMYVWDLNKQQLAQREPLDLGMDHKGDSGVVVASDDGKMIATLGADEMVDRLSYLDMFDVKTFKRDIISAKERFGRAMSFSPDSKLLALETHEHGILGGIGRGPGASRLSICTAEPLTQKWTHIPVPAPISCLAFSPDGQSVITGSTQDSMNVWNIAERSKERVIPVAAGGVDAVAYSADGAKIFAASIADDSLGIYASTSALEKSIKTTAAAPAKMTCATVSRLGRAVTGHRDGNVVYWDLGTGASLKFSQGDAEVSAVALSRDGRKALAAFSNGVVSLYELPSP